MEDSSEKMKKLHGETELGAHSCLCLPILCNSKSLFEAFDLILKLLGFQKHKCSSPSATYQQLSPSPEPSDPAASDPPPTAAYPPTDGSGLESELRGRRVPPPPLRSTGGGGQTN